MQQMKTWFNNPVAVRQQILVGCQNQQYLQPAIVEKDWWVTAVLHASITESSPYRKDQGQFDRVK